MHLNIIKIFFHFVFSGFYAKMICMSTQENLHQGHRRRLLKKVNENPSALAEHEILEAMLFFVLPRVDTNPLAHKLINVFGGLKQVLLAKKHELMAIKGVGERTADFLITAGQTFHKALYAQQQEVYFDVPEKVNEMILREFNLKTKEACIFILMDEKYRQISKLYFTDFKAFEVEIDLNEVVGTFSVFKPKYALIAHNHILGSCQPTPADDLATKQLFALCNMHGVSLVEHAIIKGKDIYSYRSEGRMDAIKYQADLKKLFE